MFTYLRRSLSRVVHIDDGFNAMIAKASAAFVRLRGRVWDRSGIRLDTKLKVYRAVVLPTPLYTCDTCTVYQRHAERLNHFHTSCLRKLLKIKWQDRILDTEVLQRAECTYSSETGTVKMDMLCYQDAGGTLAKEILYGETLPCWSEEAIPCKDTLKASLKDFNIPTESWEQLHRTDQSGEASSEEVLVNMRQKEPAKPSRNVHSAKPEQRHYQQRCLALTSIVPSATDSLELELA